jgi:hypothetical protein
MGSLTRCRPAIACILAAGGVTVQAQFPLYGNFYLHDPGTMIKDGTNYFIHGDGQGILGIKSSDLRNWTATSAVFPGSPPAWTTNDIFAYTNITSTTTNVTAAFAGYFWAPDIAWFNGRYNLYYACSQWGTRNSAIGVVTSPSLNSPVWTDQGKVVESHYPLTANADTFRYNCIDPSILVDAGGSVWMAYGSYSDGIVVTQIDPATGKRLNPASLGTKVASSTSAYDSNSEEASCLYQRGGYYYLFVNFGGCCSGVNSTYNIRVGRSATATGPYLDRGGANMTNGGGTLVLESTARYIGPGHPAIMNDNGTNWFIYHYYDGKNNGAATVGLNRISWTDDGWPALTNDWSAFYPLNTNAHEHLGLYNGTLRNNTAVTNEPGRGSVLKFDGITNFVTLPLSVGNASTFAAWVKWNGGADWQRVFDFGASTTSCFFLTPRAYGGTMRFAITTNGTEQQIDAATALPTNTWCHVAVTLDGTKGLLYLNGNPVGTNNALITRPWQTLAHSNYLGKSQWPADPLFSGEISSFRIFGRALSGSEIKDLVSAHPALAHRYSFNANAPTAAWDSIGMAHGTLKGNAVVANGALKLTGATGGYADLPGGLVSGCRAVSVEFWATLGASGSWARVFDFGADSGASGQNYFFFSPNTGTGGQRLEMATNTTVTFDVPGSLNGRSLHVVCVLDPATGFGGIYTNGILEAAVTNAWPALGSVSTAWSFLGRSLWSADAWLNGTIDEFRIYDGRLSANEIAADYAAGPDALYPAVTLTLTKAGGGYTFSWPSYPAGFTLQTSPVLGNGAVWNPVGGMPVISNGWCGLTVPASGTNVFFRLSR